MTPEEQLLKALKEGDVVTARRLVEKGAFDFGEQKLLRAIKSGDLEEVKRLCKEVNLGHFPDMNVYYDDGTTPLYVAYEEKQDEIAAFLKTYVGTQFGASFVAIDRGNLSVFQKIWDKKSLIEASEDEKIQIWNYANQKKQYDIQKHIIANDEPFIRKSIITAIKNNLFEQLKHRIDNGFDINFCGTDGVMPLHMAVAYDRPEMVKILLDAGANIFAEGLIDYSVSKDKKIRMYGTAKYMAQRLNKTQIVKIIQQYEEKKSVECQRIADEQMQSEIKELVLLAQIGQSGEQYIHQTVEKITTDLNKDIGAVQKLALVGYLCQLFELLPYQQGISVYKKIAPHTDKDVREKMKNILRNNRQK